MKLNSIEPYFEEVRKLKAEAKDSKQYNLAVKNFRYVCLQNFPEVLSDSIPADEYSFIRKRYKLYTYLAYGLLFSAVVPMIWESRYDDYELSSLPKAEVYKLVLIGLYFGILFLAAMVFAIKVRRLRNKYINELVINKIDEMR